ncbi:phosphatidylglycerophosphatase A [Glaciecola sp. HTCC2999]|uniref:phosphatidylglycerophosphatase A family protein n=1 Tax=Glaciecola sp. HTCC2999 TaxID=455436 RepID=UPI0000E0E12B|nr:phosphatidylglycerophosphatase A [Glaciecola sp. HTCC2999]
MDPELRARLRLTNPIHFLALGFGSGLIPKAPGTFGSMAALPLIFVCSLLSLPIYFTMTVIACVLGIYICGKTAEDMQVHDHGAIVWDEIAGMLCVFIAIPLSWDTALIGFILFRWLDIQKPLLIGWIDKRFTDGLGIMLDDIVAGLIACGLLHLYLYFI